MHITPFLKRFSHIKFFLGFIDALAILLAFQCSYYINYLEIGGFFFSETKLLLLFIGILPFWLLILYLIKITGVPTKRFKVLFLLYLQSSIAIFFFLILVSYIFKLYPVPRLFLLEFAILGFIFLFNARLLTYKLFRNYGEKWHNHINIIIIADDSSLMFIDNLLSKNELGYKVVVIFTESDLIKKKFENMTIILPENYLGILNDLIEVDFIDEVLYLKEKINAAEIREAVNTCEDLGVTFRLRNTDSRIKLSSAIKTDIANGKFLSFINMPNNTFAQAIKKTLDINVALLMIIILSPLLILIGIMIKLSTKGPLITKVPRTGWRGRQIELYRFRTLSLGAIKKSTKLKSEIEIETIFSDMKEDYPVTRIGKFLLLSGLDQLPQLFNVLKGEISIIGVQHPLQSDNLP
jgi:lipopolysaccharide/colanic/teichoic acid biosynthesis glycosyltransferase